MPVKASQQFVRKVFIKVYLQNGDSELKEETLTIIHRPVTGTWLDFQNRIIREENAKLQATLEDIAKQAEEAEKNNQEFDVEAAKAKLQEFSQKSILVRQLACDSGDSDNPDSRGLLIDIDHVDDEGKKIQPTQEFLHTRDLALLEEIKAEIEKKAWPVQGKTP